MPDEQETTLSGRIVGVFVGKPAVIGTVRGRPVDSAIAKAPVSAPEIELTTTNLAGDRQADLSVHGGPEKAVYVYPSASYAAWQADGFALDAGGVGENVSLAGLDEDAVLLGDTWRWGDALVQVSQPRGPCCKLSLHTGRKDVGPRMIATGRCGWYLRVLQPGTVPTSGDVTLTDRLDGAPTMRQTFLALYGDGTGDGDGSDPVLERVLASPALSEEWRTPLLARRDRSGT